MKTKIEEFYRLFPEIGQEVWYFPELERTIPVQKGLIKDFPTGANGRIVIASKLTEAKGRFQRTWFAEKGGLWLSVSIYDEFSDEVKSLIPLLPGLAICRTANALGIPQARVKWINDVHVKGKKLAGVLIECYENWFLIGMGININNHVPGDIPAVSIKDLTGRDIELSRVLESLIFWLQSYFGYLRFYESNLLKEDFKENAILKDFKVLSDTLGRCVAYSYNLESEDYLIGKAVGVTEKGELILDVNGEHVFLKTGEVIYLF